MSTSNIEVEFSIIVQVEYEVIRQERLIEDLQIHIYLVQLSIVIANPPSK